MARYSCSGFSFGEKMKNIAMSYDGKRIRKDLVFAYAAENKINISTIQFYFACVTRMISELRENKIHTHKTFSKFLTSDKRTAGGKYYKYKAELTEHKLIELNQFNHLTFVVKNEWLYHVNSDTIPSEQSHMPIVDDEMNNSKTIEQETFQEYLSKNEFPFANEINMDTNLAAFNCILDNFIETYPLKNEKAKLLFTEFFCYISKNMINNDSQRTNIITKMLNIKIKNNNSN